MTQATKDQTLREMAAHRGFKLVKSRRRKVGASDYGKYGLTDGDGKSLLGVSDDGLTASLEDIEVFLRDGATSTWRASADAVPSRAVSTKKAGTSEKKVEPAIKPRPKWSTGGKPSPSAKITGDAVNRSRPVPSYEPAQLRIRSAKPADAAGITTLLRQLDTINIDEPGVVDNLGRIKKAGGGTLVTVLEGIVGCCTWALIPMVHYGLIGRITLLLVDESHRRNGIATAMLDAATTALREAECTQIEAMSDIEIKNAHDFFRTSKFEQISYRFARGIDPKA